MDLKTPVKYIKRVGERVAAGLAERGVATIEDLLYHLPFRYEDRLHPKPLSAYRAGDMASLMGEVRGSLLLKTRSAPIFEMTVGVKPPGVSGRIGEAGPSPSAQDDNVRMGGAGKAGPSPSAQDDNVRMGGAREAGPSSSAQDDNVRMGGAGKAGPSPSAQDDNVRMGGAREAGPSSSAQDDNVRMGGAGKAGPSPSAQDDNVSLGGAGEAGPSPSAQDDNVRMGGAGKAGPSPSHPNEQRPLAGGPDSAQDADVSLGGAGKAGPSPAHPNEQRPLAGGPDSAQDDNVRMGGAGEAGPSLETVKCLWFHGGYLKDKFKAGQTIALYGKLESSRSGSTLGMMPGARAAGVKFKMVQPTFEILPDAMATGEDAEFTMLEMGRIVPVYESLGGKTPWGAKLTSRWLRRVMWTVFKELLEDGAEADETLPKLLRERLSLPGRMESLQGLHFPPAGTAMTELMSARTPAHRRLIFEEFWYLELGLELKRRRLREREGTVFVTDEKVREALKQVLPFKPTSAQKRVLGEIAGDMRKPQPMRRLLQGDVGSGKTIVAFQAALVAIENGYQVAMMAPTEILATQHYLGAKKLLGGVVSPKTGKPYRVALLTGSLDDRSKREVRGRIFRGEVDLAIGTHALVEEKVDFDNLGLVIVDEQHRFGVEQRFKLMRKPGASGVATEPDVLVMTATPIPRTLALTMYGDLEASVIDELPPGRSPIVTRRLQQERSDEVWGFVRKQVEAGRQAYVVYPVIEGAKDDQPELDFAGESIGAAGEAGPSAMPPDDNKKSRGKKAAADMLERKAPRRKAQRQRLRSATEMFEELSAGALKGLKLGLLHGRMSADDKEVTMARFKRGEIDVLVSTTVIEVGVDVPNSTVMVIEHADRFGLAQMHQLRGRVGRGVAKSYCVLVTSATISPEADERLNAMVRTQNGFELAEFDLQLRGPGEFFGTRQAGLPEFRVANLGRDREILELAKVEAARFVEAPDPAMPRSEIEAVWARLKQQWQRRYGLVEA